MEPQIQAKVNRLCTHFTSYVVVFNEKDQFTGPSLYFHFRTLERLKSLGLPHALNAVIFLEYLYAVLTAWGLYRMGQAARLVDFEQFRASLLSKTEDITALKEYRLTELSDVKERLVLEKLCEILSGLKISASGTQLVAGTKTLHHLLPNLVPPIDIKYIVKFFYGYNPHYLSDERKFRFIFPLQVQIGQRCIEDIRKYIGQGFNTSETKVIDNAIIGYMLKEER